MSIRGIDAPLATPAGYTRWEVEPADSFQRLDVSVGFLTGFSSIKVEGYDLADSQHRPTVVALTHGQYRMLTAAERGRAPIAGLPAGTVPPDTVVCALPHHGSAERRRRNGDVRSPERLLYLHVERTSFELAMRARLSAIGASGLAGEQTLLRMWNRYGPSVEPLLVGTAIPRVPASPTAPDVVEPLALGAAEGVVWVWARSGTVLGKANGAGTRARRFRIEIAAQQLTSRGGRPRRTFVTPVPFIQDVLMAEGKVTFTPYRDDFRITRPLIADLSSPPRTAASDDSHFPQSTDAFTQHLLPVFDQETACRPNHKRRRRLFGTDNGSAGFVFPAEYTNPTRPTLSSQFISAAAASLEAGVPGLDCADAARQAGTPSGVVFTPASSSTVVIGCVEYRVPHVQNWSAAGVHHYDRRRLVYDYTTIRPPAATNSVVIHDTTHNNYRPTRTRLNAHFLIERDGTTSQIADLLERVSHADLHSDHAIGIEVANDIMFQLDTRGGAIQEPAGDLTDPEFHVEVPWLEWRPPGSRNAWTDPHPTKMRIPPRGCLDALWRLVEWLTGPGHPLPIPRIFPQLDPRYWPAAELSRLQVLDPTFTTASGATRSRLDEYVAEWAGLIPAAEFSAGARYWHVITRGHARHTMIDAGFPGVLGHCAISGDRWDGLVTTLYLWMRSIGLNHSDAHRHTKSTLGQSRVALPSTSGAYFVQIQLPATELHRVPQNRLAGP